MGFFDKLSESISTGSAKVAETAKELKTVATLNAQIDKDTKLVEKTFTEIGKLYFEQFKDELNAKFPEQVAKIDEANANIEKNKEAIRVAKGINLCPQCGKEVAKDTKFCPACGAKMPEPVVEEVVEAPAETVKCPACGEELPAGTAFCTKCGAKVSE